MISTARSLRIYRILREQETAKKALRQEYRELSLLNKKSTRPRLLEIHLLENLMLERHRRLNRLLERLVRYTKGEIQEVRNWYPVLKALDRKG